MSSPDTEVTRSELDTRTLALIDAVAREVRAAIEQGRLPDIELPVRSLDNGSYDKA